MNTADFSVVLFRPNFVLVFEGYPALHQKSFLHRIFRVKIGLSGLEKAFKMRLKRRL